MSQTDSASPINTIIIKIILHTYLSKYDILHDNKHPFHLCLCLLLSDTDTDVCTERAIRWRYGLLPIYKCFARDVDGMDFANCGEVGH